MPLHGADVHRAIFGTLTAALAPTPVYDIAPEDAAFPFVDMSKQIMLPVRPGMTPLAGDLTSHNLYLAVWSNYRGQAEVLGIMAQIHAALHNQQLALASGTCVLCQVTSAETVLDADGLTHQGAITVHLEIAN